jgi:two-component system, sensor histidine kinase
MPESVKVLLVEDNLADAKLVMLALNEAKGTFEIEHVSTASAMMKRLRKEECPDVVLLDLQLPDSSGLDTLESVVNACPHTPIIVLSGLDDEDFIIEAANSGASEYVIKNPNSITPSNMRKVIYYVIRQRENVILETIESGLKKGLEKISEIKDISKKIGQTLTNGATNGHS